MVDEFKLSSDEMLKLYVEKFRKKKDLAKKIQIYANKLKETYEFLQPYFEYWKQQDQSEQAKQIARERYLWDEAEDWDMLSRRVAISIASGYTPFARVLKSKEEKNAMSELAFYAYQLYYNLVSARVALPNTPTLVNSGVGVDREIRYAVPTKDNILDLIDKVYDQLDRRYQFSACNVLSIEDDMEAIMDTLKQAALISKGGGGIGLNFGRLRYKDAPLSNGGTSSGSISFLELFDKMLATIKQGGKTRRGAGMATHGYGNLNKPEFWHDEFTIHPDAIDFISSKRDNDGESKLSNFNISFVVNNTADFLYKIKQKAPVKAVFNDVVVKENVITADKLFDTIAEHAWKTGDPGLVFLDKMNENNPVANILPIESTNVCGEQPLISSFEHNIIGSCNLISIDLFKVVYFAFANNYLIDKLLNALATAGYDLLDAQLDLLMFPVEGQKRGAMLLRNVGVGYTALAGASAVLGVYSNDDRELSEIMADLAYRTGRELELASRRMSTDKSVVFGNYLLYKYADYSDDTIGELHGVEARRNIAVTTIQPSGTVGILMQTEQFGDVGQGVEPFYSLYYIRKYRENNTQKWKTLEYTNKLFTHLANIPQDRMEELTAKLKKNNGRSEALDHPLAEYFKTALEMHWKEHLKVLSKASAYISSAVSKTINLPENATTKDVKELFIKAMEDLYIKDITIYRDGSLKTQVLKSKPEKEDKSKTFMIGKLEVKVDKSSGHILPKERPAMIMSYKKELRFKVNGDIKKVYIEVGFADNNEPFEVFFRATESTKEYAPFFNLAGRMASLALRSGVDKNEIFKQIRKVKNWRNEYDPVANILADAVIEIIEFVKAKGKKKQTLKELEELKKGWIMTPKGYYIDEEGKPRCPVCGEVLVLEAGCATCKACGYSACTDA